MKVFVLERGRRKKGDECVLCFVVCGVLCFVVCCVVYVFCVTNHIVKEGFVCDSGGVHWPISPITTICNNSNNWSSKMTLMMVKLDNKIMRVG